MAVSKIVGLLEMSCITVAEKKGVFGLGVIFRNTQLRISTSVVKSERVLHKTELRFA